MSRAAQLSAAQLEKFCADQRTLIDCGMPGDDDGEAVVAYAAALVKADEVIELVQEAQDAAGLILAAVEVYAKTGRRVAPFEAAFLRRLQVISELGEAA